MVLNINIGILGHVNSGKTTLAKALSSISSTACFDKNPQSRERGITLDLGFSALIIDTPENLRLKTDHDQIQFTFVDCPGHASLIRTIIGGAQIIDLMILVVDVQKGIQTQTAECLVIGEITCKKHLIIVINKIDTLEMNSKDMILKKLKTRLKRTLSNTSFGNDIPIFELSALNGIGLNEFIIDLCKNISIPKRNSNEPFLFAVDHCFSIKGQGTICTGTVLQGKICLSDTIEIPKLKELKKIKSIQMFRKPVDRIQQGDRAGICITQFNPDLIERGLLAEPNFIKYIWAGIIPLNIIKYYKNTINSKSKFHISIGHETVMGSITLFKSFDNETNFQLTKTYEYLNQCTIDDNLNSNIFVLIEFEKCIYTISNALLIGSKLDLDIQLGLCRIAFFGNLQWFTNSSNYMKDVFGNLKIYKNKIKQGTIQRVINQNDIIVDNMFKKESKRNLFIGLKVNLSTGEEGFIDSTFGQTSKIKVSFRNGISENTLNLLKTKGHNIVVQLKFKKYIFNKNHIIEQ